MPLIVITRQKLFELAIEADCTSMEWAVSVAGPEADISPVDGHSRKKQAGSRETPSVR